MIRIDFSQLHQAREDAAAAMPSIAGKKILMGFWHNWPAGAADGYQQGSFANIALEDVPSEYNVVAVAFMKGRGIPTFQPYNLSDAEFRRQVGVLNAQGRAVLISLGAPTRTSSCTPGRSRRWPPRSSAWWKPTVSTAWTSTSSRAPSTWPTTSGCCRRPSSWCASTTPGRASTSSSAWPRSSLSAQERQVRALSAGPGRRLRLHRAAVLQPGRRRPVGPGGERRQGRLDRAEQRRDERRLPLPPPRAWPPAAATSCGSRRSAWPSACRATSMRRLPAT